MSIWASAAIVLAYIYLGGLTSAIYNEVLWSTAFISTIAITLVTRQEKTDAELSGLVYGMTRRVESSEGPWWQRPSRLGAVVIALVVLLNIAFW